MVIQNLIMVMLAGFGGMFIGGIIATRVVAKKSSEEVRFQCVKTAGLTAAIFTTLYLLIPRQSVSYWDVGGDGHEYSPRPLIVTEETGFFSHSEQTWERAKVDEDSDGRAIYEWRAVTEPKITYNWYPPAGDDYDN